MITRSMSVLALVCCCSFSYAEDSVEIPLDTVWALNIPGTKNILELEPKRKRIPPTDEELINTSPVEQMKQALNHRHSPKKGEKARQSFVVLGTGLDALREARDVLSGEKQRTDSLPTNKELSLIFYAYDPGRSLQLNKIERRDNVITVRYHLIVPEGFISPEYVSYFALIPLGKLPAGKFNVDIERLPDVGGTAFVRQRYARLDNRISDSFSFEIADAID